MPTPIRRRSRSAMNPKRPAIAFLSICFLSLFFVVFIFLRGRSFHPLSAGAISSTAVSASIPATSRRNIIFSVASSARSWPNRRSYVRLWYSPNTTRAFVFLDRNDTVPIDSAGFPPAVVSGDTSRFSYSFPGGLPSAVRVARVVKEVVELVDSAGDGGEDHEEVRWFVFGDDDTAFFVENLARTLAKYDHERWFYVGSISESFDQNSRNFFGMAFGGGGFAISASLARALAGVLDSCLLRYAHLYGSDARIYSCVAELGVGLTHEPGFHQVDVRGNLFGLLSSHPLSPVLSLHHLDAVDPIFPDANRTEALGRLFQASDSDPVRVLQQTVCYDSSQSVTVTIAWGYAVQVFEGNKLLVDLLSVQKTFTTWRRGFNYGTGYYMFNTRDNIRDACKRPAIYYLQSVVSNSDGDVQSDYKIYESGKCKRSDIVKNLKHIKISSKKLEPDIEEMKAMRRQCCDILPGFNESMVINLRKCRVNELISMNP